jgi:predicted RecA/RadA family phage recombinase
MHREYGGQDGRIEHVMAASGRSGDVVQLTTGELGVIMSVGDFVTGDTVMVATDIEADFACATGTTFSAGANVFYNLTTRLVVASGVHPGMGEAVRAKTSGQLIARVRLNRIALPAGT